MKISKFGRLALGLSILSLAAYALTVSAAGGYHLIKKVPLAAAPGGSEYFDYIFVDPANAGVVKNIDRVGAVECPAVDGKGMVYDNNEAKNDVVAIDSKTLTIKARWPVAPEGQAVALAIDAKNRRLFSAGRNPQFMVMMDADKGNVIQSFPITPGVDAIQFEPSTPTVSLSTRE